MIPAPNPAIRSRRRAFLPRAVAVLYSCAAALPSPAQTNTAAISGAVSDSRGAAVRAADVTAVHTGTGVRTAVRTNDSGLYLIPNLPAGPYTLQIEHAGFRAYSRAGLVLTTSRTLVLDAVLEIGPLTESVSVTAAEPLLNTRTSDAGQLIDAKSVEALPLGNRRTMNVIQTAGAVVPVSNDNLPTYSLAGGRLQSQMVWIDGGTGQNIRIGVGQQNVDPPVEAVQEIKVLSNSYSAEYGGSAGGVVLQTTRSGANRPSGVLYEYARNNALDAPGFFAPSRDGSRLSPELRYHVFGLTAGGPIRRNRTFFFGSWEQTRRRTGSVATLTVPSPLERAGDFSQTFDQRAGLVVIYDPATAPRQPFPRNAIPAARLDPVARNAAAYFPLPNRIADTITGANNFRANLVTAVSSDFLLVKIDHNAGDRDRLTARYIAYRTTTTPSSVYPDPGADPATVNTGRSHYIHGAWTRILGASRVNDLRFTYVNRSAHLASLGLGGGYPARLGLAGVDPAAFPQFAPSGFSPIGSAAQERRQYPIEQHQVVDNFTWLRGRHALKFGVEARRSRDYEINLPAISGAFAFTPQATAFPGNAATGNSLASMLLGLPASFTLQVTDQLDRRSWYLAGFVQDDWSVSRSLTLNIGLRWEVDTPLADANLRLNSFDPLALNPVSGTPGVVRFAGRGGVPGGAYGFDWNNFAPRIGFAWRPAGSKRAVLRAGYGVFFAHPMDGAQATAASLGFSRSASLRSPDNGFTPPFVLRDGVPPVVLASPSLDDAFGAVKAGQSPATAVPYFERGRVSGYAHQFNLALQTQFSSSIAAEASLLGNLGRKLPSANLSINQIPPAVLGPARHFQADRPFPQFSDVSLAAPSLGVSNYYAMLLKLEKRLGLGLNLLATYCWSKFLGNTNDSANPAAGSLGAENGPYSNYYNRRADYGPLENDIERRFTLGSVYELPFGKGRRWLASGAAARLAGGWTLGLLATVQSGAALTAVTQTNTSNAFSAGAQRADVSRNPNLPSSERTLTRWFGTEAFSQPALYTFGNQGPGQLRAAGLVNADFSLLRIFALPRALRLQVRGEFFNAFNHTNFLPPGTVFGPAFGVIGAARPARQIQIGARLLF